MKDVWSLQLATIYSIDDYLFEQQQNQSRDHDSPTISMGCTKSLLYVRNRVSFLISHVFFLLF